MLVDVTDDELRHGLHRFRIQGREAGREERRDSLVEADHLVGHLTAAETGVVVQNETDAQGQDADDGIAVDVGDVQFSPPVPFIDAVDEREGREERAHPAVLPDALQDFDGVSRHHGTHVAEVLEPGGIVLERVLYAAPFPVAGNAGTVIAVAGALSALSVLREPDGVEALQFLIDKRNDLLFHRYAPFPAVSSFLISRPSTNAWNRVRSCPAPVSV